MPRLAAPPTFQPKSSLLVAAESTLTATSDQRVIIPSIRKRGHVLPDVAPSRHALRPTFLRKPRDQVHSLSEHSLEKPSKPEKLDAKSSRLQGDIETERMRGARPSTLEREVETCPCRVKYQN